MGEGEKRGGGGGEKNLSVTPSPPHPLTLAQFDIAIVGGGIIGLATALAITQNSRLSVVVLEAADEVAAHQTGNNSGVVHSGLYYKPGSLKAVNCIRGRDALYAFCERYGVAFERCGKVVVATEPEELERLAGLEKRGRANGLNLKRLSGDELKDFEPHLVGLAGLWIPETGIVDYTQVAQTYARLAQEAGGTVQTGSRVLSVQLNADELVLETTQGDVHCRYLVNCAGLQADRVAKLCGVEPGVQVIPFRGEYYELVPDKHHLVKNLIYPVPDPRFPFLGVHFTRMVHGGIEAGPNAVLALKREGYKPTDIDLGDLWETVSWQGFWRLAAQHWRMGTAEIYRSLSKPAYVRTLQRLIPELSAEDVYRAGAGVRAQALAPDGKLLDDFHIVQTERMLHVLNAPSPAATASLSIGQTLFERLREAAS